MSLATAAPKTGEITAETNKTVEVAAATKVTKAEADTNQEEAVTATNQEVVACPEVAVAATRLEKTVAEAISNKSLVAGAIEEAIEVAEAAEAAIEEEPEEDLLQEMTSAKEKMKEVLQTGAEVPLKILNPSEEVEVDLNTKVDNVEDTRQHPLLNSDQRLQAHQVAVHQWSSRRTTTRDLLSTSQAFVSKSTSRT
jgi:hypothetical protein